MKVIVCCRCELLPEPIEGRGRVSETASWLLHGCVSTLWRVDRWKRKVEGMAEQEKSRATNERTAEKVDGEKCRFQSKQAGREICQL